jgi:hypothetical protein
VPSPDFRAPNNLTQSRIVYSRDYTATDSKDYVGHGTLVAAVVGGYNLNEGSVEFEDADGYQYGLGIAPPALLGSSKLFRSATTLVFPPIVRDAYISGARVINNSWVDTYTDGLYTTTSQTYDMLVRDANSSGSGNQQVTIVFVSGTDGQATPSEC